MSRDHSEGQEQKSAIKHNVAIESWLNVLRALKKIQPNSASPQTAFEMKRVAEHYAAHARESRATYSPNALPNTKRDDFIASAVHMMASKSSFRDNCDKISDITFSFLKSKSAEGDAAEQFLRNSLLEVQSQFLAEIKNVTEISPVDTYDTMEKLMNSANIPRESRPLYRQHCLNVLAQIDDNTVPAVVTVNQDACNNLACAIRTHLDIRKAQKPINQKPEAIKKHFDLHHESTKKIKTALVDDAVYQQLSRENKEIINYIKDQKARADQLQKEQQQEKRDQQEIDGYKKFGQFLGMLGDVTHEKILKDAGTVCLAGVMAYEAYTGFNAVMAVEAAVAAGTATTSATIGSCLGPVAMAAMAALMLISMLVKDDSEPQEDPFQKSVMQALQQIMSKLEEMQKQMHERFNQLVGIELETRELMLEGFKTVISYAKEIIAHHLQHEHGQEKLSRKVDLFSSDLQAGLAALQNTLIKPIVSAILNPTQKDYLKNLSAALYSAYSTKLETFIGETSCSPVYNGYGKINYYCGKSVIDPVEIANQFYDQSSPTDKTTERLYNLLGLLAGLSNHHVAGLIQEPELMPNPNQWKLCILAYKTLLLESNQKLQKDKAAHIQEMSTILNRAEKVKIFLEAISKSKTLFEKLITQYHQDLSNIETLIHEHCAVQEKQYYQDKAIIIQPGESSIKLNETFNEASERQVDSYLHDACERAPVDFKGRARGFNFMNLGGECDVIFTEDLHVRQQYPGRGCVNGDNCNAKGVCTCSQYNASQYAWGELKKHYDKVVKPVIEGMQLAGTEKELSLGLRLGHLLVTRNLNMSLLDAATTQYAAATVSHSFQNEIGLKAGNTITFISGTSNYLDINGDHHLHREMFMLNHLDRSTAYPGGGWAITTINKLSLENLSKETAKLIHPELKRYRASAMTQLLADVELTKAFEKLESSALQIHAFINLLDIDTTYFKKPLRTEQIKIMLGEIIITNSDESLAKLKKLLSDLADKKAIEADDFFSGMPIDITQNPLYCWAEKVKKDLSDLEKTINAWPDIQTLQAEGSDAALLMAEIRELRKEVAALRSEIKAAEETDSDDEKLLIAESGSVQWKKIPGRKPGERELDPVSAANASLRSTLFHKPPGNRKTRTDKNAAGEKTLVIQLMTYSK